MNVDYAIKERRTSVIALFEAHSIVEAARLIFISGLPKSASAESIREYFGHLSLVIDVQTGVDKGERFSTTALVTFKAAAAVQASLVSRMST